MIVRPMSHDHRNSRKITIHEIVPQQKSESRDHKHEYCEMNEAKIFTYLVASTTPFPLLLRTYPLKSKPRRPYRDNRLIMIEGDWIAERMLYQDDPFTDEFPGEVSLSEANDENDTSTKQLLGPEEVRSTDNIFASFTRSSSRRRNGAWVASVRSYCLITTLLVVLLILVIRRVVQNNNNDSRVIVVPTLAPALVPEAMENITDRSNSPSVAPSKSPTANITQVPTAEINNPNDSSADDTVSGAMACS